MVGGLGLVVRRGCGRVWYQFVPGYNKELKRCCFKVCVLSLLFGLEALLMAVEVGAFSSVGEALT